MSEPVRFLRAAPCLASLSQDETERFYTEKLGFERAFRYPGYMSMRRDGLEIHVWHCDDPEIPKLTSCCVYLENAATHGNLIRFGQRLAEKPTS